MPKENHAWELARARKSIILRLLWTSEIPLVSAAIRQASPSVLIRRSIPQKRSCTFAFPHDKQPKKSLGCAVEAVIVSQPPHEDGDEARTQLEIVAFYCWQLVGCLVHTCLGDCRRGIKKWHCNRARIFRQLNADTRRSRARRAENEFSGEWASAVISSWWLNLSSWIYEQNDRLQANLNSTRNTW